MPPMLRGSVVAAVLAVSFAAGYYLKPVPVIPTAVAQAPAPPPPPTDLPLVLPPMDEVKPAAAAVDPNDPTLRMIRDSLGIKTTVLDKNEPLPPVLADAMKEPVPMGGPMPRLGPPPAPALPMIDPSPIRGPDSAPAVRITIRDAGGHVTTLTTTGRVTIDLIGPDGTMPEPGPMPHLAGFIPDAP